MPDEESSIKSLADLVPNVYFDLIARVGSGVPFVVLFLWSYKSSLKDAIPDTGVKLLLLLGAGYIVGILLTPVSLVWNLVIMPLARFVLHVSGFDWRRSELNEEIGVKHKRGFVNLEKMQAEATLCQNLLSGYVILIVADRCGVSSVQALQNQGSVRIAILFLLLLFCAVFQTLVYVRRQRIVHQLYLPKGH